MILCAGFAAWVGAQSPRRLLPSEQIKLLQRNQALYRVAVKSSIETTAQFDPLERTRSSMILARELSGEIKSAAQNQDAARVAELGRLLAQLIDQGVTPNIQLARTRIPAGSEAERLLFQRRDEVLEILKPLEESVRTNMNSNNRDVAGMLRDLSAGREKLERSAKE
jgi:hypothetical protein